MIYSLSGTITYKDSDFAVINVGGVGFLVNVPTTVSANMPNENENCTLYTYMSVKEDAIDLFGFNSKAQLDCFKLLISVSGVGPKAGLSILSVLSPSDIALAISSGDYKTLTAAQGIGPKVAQRIVLELKNKFTDTDFTQFDNKSDTVHSTSVVAQAVSALVALGYSQSLAAKAVAVCDKSADVQSLIKQALKLLARGKV